MRPSHVYEPIYTVKNMYNNFIILQDVFLTWKLCSFFSIFYVYFGIILQVTIIDLSSPLGASLYNIDTRLCYQRTSSSSSKCREKIRWRPLSINNGCEGKQKIKNRKFG